MAYISTAARFLLAWIDQIVIWGIEKIYNLLISMTNLTIFSDKIIATLGKRISILIGVFFLFRAAFAIIQYIVTPDKISDGKSGTSKIVINVVISLLLLLSYNFLFKQAYILQGKILGVEVVKNCTDSNDESTCTNTTQNSGGVLEKIIFGVGNVNTSSNINTAGELMAYSMYTAFVYPNPDVVGDACENVYIGGTDVSAQANAASCNKALADADVDSDTRLKFTQAIASKKASKLVDYDILTDMSKNQDGKDDNTFSYFPIVSTICAGIVLLILVNFCIDCALRMVKLGFLQLIAPIPILSYIIPNQKNMLSKWAGECGKAYVDIFVRLLALYFAIFVIMAVLNTGVYDVTTGDKVAFWTNPIGVIMIILGALIFAQQLPKLISNITGINLDGSFTLNPLKKLGDAPFVSGAVGGIAGAAVGAYANYHAAKDLEDSRKLGKLRTAMSTFGGIFTGGARGMAAGAKEKGPLNKSLSKSADAAIMGSRKIAAMKDTTFLGRNLAQVQDRTWSSTEADLIEDKLKSYNDFAKSASSFKSAARAEVEKNKDNRYRDAAVARARVEALQSMDISRMNNVQRENHYEQLKTARDGYELEMKKATEAEMNRQLLEYNKGNFAEAPSANDIANMQKLIKEDSEYFNTIRDSAGNRVSIDSASKINTSKDLVEAESIRVNNDDRTIQARANAEYARNTRERFPGRPGKHGGPGKK